MDVLVRIGIRILEFMFFAGWVGSLLVILLSGIEDIAVVAGQRDNGQSVEVVGANQANP